MTSLTHQRYVSTLIAEVRDLSYSVLTKWLKAKLPFLNLPILSQLTDYFIKKIVTKLYSEADILIFFHYTDLRVRRQGQEYMDAAIAWHNIKDDSNATDEEKAKAREHLISSFTAFAKLGMRYNS